MLYYKKKKTLVFLKTLFLTNNSPIDLHRSSISTNQLIFVIAMSKRQKKIKINLEFMMIQRKNSEFWLKS